MSKKNYEWEWTFESIGIDEFYMHQKNNITKSFWKCPDCEKETLNIETRECECWYNLEHKVINVVDNIKVVVKNEIKVRICGCSQPIIWDYSMCRECYWKSKI